MKQDLIFPDFFTSLEAILREGAQKLLQQAIENEVIEYLERHSLKGPDNRKVVRRNGYLPKRSIQSGIGPISIKQPRVRGGQYIPFVN